MALSEKVKSEIEKIRHQFPTEQALLIPLLHAIQAESGHITQTQLKEAGEFLHLPFSKVREVATFYTMFNLKPVGQVHLQLCANISCWLNGSERLMRCLENRLGVGCGETTSDGKFTLSEVECLAACGTAPVMQVNEDYYENLNEEKLNQLMDDIDKRLKKGDQTVGYSTRDHA